MKIQNPWRSSLALAVFAVLPPVSSAVASDETLPDSYVTTCNQQLVVSQYAGLSGTKLADPQRHLYVTRATAGVIDPDYPPLSLDTSMLVDFSSCDDASTYLAINLRKTWDFYKNVYNRRGFSNQNDAMLAYIDTGITTAQSNGGSRLLFSNSCINCMTTLETVAHEFTHSVLGQTTSFHGSRETQSQALNESLSSVFGMAVHNYWYKDNSYIYMGGVEDLSDPRRCGGIDHMDFYRTGDSADAHVIGNGGVIAKAAYLLAEGGRHSYSQVSVSGIGRAKMERIFYYTMTNNNNANTRLTKDATFQQFAEVAYQAVQELYPTEKMTIASVYWAFKAVGLTIPDVNEGRMLFGSGSGIMRNCYADSPGSCTDFNSLGSTITATATANGYIYVGLANGLMWRCGQNTQHSCTVFNTANTAINTLLLANGYIYAGLNGGVMWRCDLNTPDSCTVFNIADAAINTLMLANGYIYAGLSNGIMWRCGLNTPHSCTVHNTAPSAIKTLTQVGGFIYTGLANGLMWRCGLNTPNTCSTFNDLASAFKTMIPAEGGIFTTTENGRMWRCELNVPNSCNVINTASTSINTLSMVKNYLYAGLNDGVIWRCNPSATNSCYFFDSTGNGAAVSQAFVPSP